MQPGRQQSIESRTWTLQTKRPVVKRKRDLRNRLMCLLVGRGMARLKSAREAGKMKIQTGFPYYSLEAEFLLQETSALAPRPSTLL